MEPGYAERGMGAIYSARKGANEKASLMSDAVNLVKSLFPTARVTSTKRSPTSVLGRKNPRSYRNIGRAIDIAPIPGVKFKDYVRSLENAGLDIVEAIEEVGKGRSKHATGDHWHVAVLWWLKGS